MPYSLDDLADTGNGAGEFTVDDLAPAPTGKFSVSDLAGSNAPPSTDDLRKQYEAAQKDLAKSRSTYDDLKAKYDDLQQSVMPEFQAIQTGRKMLDDDLYQHHVDSQAWNMGQRQMLTPGANPGEWATRDLTDPDDAALGLNSRQDDLNQRLERLSPDIDALRTTEKQLNATATALNGQVAKANGLAAQVNDRIKRDAAAAQPWPWERGPQPSREELVQAVEAAPTTKDLGTKFDLATGTDPRLQNAVQGAGKYVLSGIPQAAQGLAEIVHGVKVAPWSELYRSHPDLEAAKEVWQQSKNEIETGVSDALEGAWKLATPAMAVGAAVNPATIPATALVLGLTSGASTATESVAKRLGASDTTSRFVGDLFGLAAATVAGHPLLQEYERFKTEDLGILSSEQKQAIKNLQIDRKIAQDPDAVRDAYATRVAQVFDGLKQQNPDGAQAVMDAADELAQAEDASTQVRDALKRRVSQKLGELAKTDPTAKAQLDALNDAYLWIQNHPPTPSGPDAVSRWTRTLADSIGAVIDRLNQPAPETVTPVPPPAPETATAQPRPAMMAPAAETPQPPTSTRPVEPPPAQEASAPEPVAPVAAPEEVAPSSRLEVRRQFAPGEEPVEEAAATDLEQHTPEVVEGYRKQFGNVINADNAREYIASRLPEPLDNPHAPENFARLQTTTNALVRELYKTAIDEPAKPGQQVLFLAGGTGAGKSTFANGVKDDFHAIVDTTLTHQGVAEDMIQRARDQGYGVNVTLVMRDPREAYRDGVLPREEETGRPVPEEMHAQRHEQAPVVAQALADRFQNDPGVQFQLVENKTGEPLTIHPFSALPSIAARYTQGHGPVESAEPVSVAPRPEVAPEGGEGGDRGGAEVAGEARPAEPAKPEAPVEGVERKFSSTQFDLPHEVAVRVRDLGRNLIPDDALADDGREADPHLTVRFGLAHDQDIAPLRAALKNQPPITVKLGKTSIFPASESGNADVVKLDVDSPELRQVRQKIEQAVEAPGETHPDYQPHVTLAYVKPGEGERFAGNSDLAGEEVTLKSLTFSRPDGSTVEIPLKGKTAEPAPADELSALPGGTIENLEARIAQLPEGAKKRAEELYSGVVLNTRYASEAARDRRPKIEAHYRQDVAYLTDKLREVLATNEQNITPPVEDGATLPEETPNGRVEVEPVGQHAPGPSPERGAGGPVGDRTGGAPVLEGPPAEPESPSVGAGARGVGAGDSGPSAPSGVRDRADAESEPQVAQTRSGGVLPRPALPTSGAAGNPGTAQPDYQLTSGRVDVIVQRGNLERINDNLDAIKLIRTLQAEKRYATEDEQAALAKYVGWGATDIRPFLEDKPRPNWTSGQRAAWNRLQAETTPEDRAKFIQSSPNAHYTYGLYQPIWDALRTAGFVGGRVLEPAVGTGHAFGFMPPDVRAASTLSASEQEPLTAAIAQALYPSARVQPVGFEKIRLPRNTQDLVISNVPFGDFGVRDPRMEDFLTHRIHNYFFAKALQYVRPDGLILFVTSRYTMDGADAARVRSYLMEHAHFVGAIRLPNTAFDKSAKTEVVTDLIVLQKKSTPAEPARQSNLFTETSQIEGLRGEPDRYGRPTAIYHSSWYEAHPEFLLGKETTEGTQYGANQYTLEGTHPDLSTAIREALQQILPEGSYVAPTTKATETPAIVEPLETGTYKAGELRVSPDGKGIVKIDVDGNAQDWTPRKVDKKTGKASVDESAVKRIAGLIGVRDARREVVAIMRDGQTSDKEVQRAQHRLNRAYEQFVKAHGILNSRQNKKLFEDDPEAANLLELEITEPRASETINKKGERTIRVAVEVVGKADIFTKRTIKAPVEITHAESPHDALLASLGTRAQIDWPYMSRISGQTPEDLQRTLVSEGRLYRDPTGAFVTSEEYLSGDVVTKLEDARSAAERDPEVYANNVAGLEAVQPPRKTANDITITFGAHWVNPAYMRQFMADELGVSPERIRLGGVKTEALVSWAPEFSDGGAGKQHQLAVPYGVRDEKTKALTRTVGIYSVDQMFKDALNLKMPVVQWEVSVGDSKIFEKDPIATLAVRGNIETLRTRWTEWVAAHPDIQSDLVETYNDRFNRTRQREYDGAHLTFPGLALPYEPHPHQKSYVWRGLVSGNTLAEHAVGAGKAQPLTAKLLTPDGWVEMGNLSVGDTVIAGDGTPTRVEGVYPQGVKDIFRVEFSDGSSTECCDEHLWLTQTYSERTAASAGVKKGKKWRSAEAKVRSLSEIRSSLRSPHLNAKNHSIPMMEPAQMNARPTVIDPYVMGVLLGDGTFAGSSLSVSTADDEIRQAVEKALPDECRMWRIGTSYDYRISMTARVVVGGGFTASRHPWISALREYGLWGLRSWEKHIPREYLFNSEAVRVSVLQGLLDTDGDVSKRGTSVYFTTTSERLADNVEFLVQSLGGVARRSLKKRPKFTYRGIVKVGRIAHRVCVSLPPSVMPFRVVRKAIRVKPKTKYRPRRYIVAVKPVGKKLAQCIKVAHSSSLYVTDDCIVTHNTNAAIMLAMMMRMTGRARKPMITVPTNLLSQWRAAILQAYPTAKVAAFDEKDLEAKKRQRAMAKIAHGDWDIVLVPHSSFELLHISDERMVQMFQAMADELERAQKETEKGKSKRDRDPSVSEIERKRRQIEDKIAKRTEKMNASKDHGLVWEDLGIDALFVDESHAHKNLFAFTKMDRVRGLSLAESERALDMYVKIQDINTQSNYRNLHFLTATPIMNSIVEAFTVQRYLQPQRLRDLGIDNFDSWYQMFGHALPTTEQRPDGTYQEVMRVREFNNVGLLYSLMAEVMDHVGNEDMPYLKLPKWKGDKVEVIEAQPHPAYGQLKDWFSRRLEVLAKNPPHMDRQSEDWVAPDQTDPLTGAPTGRMDNVIAVMGHAKLAAIDVRLILGNRATDYKGSRLQKWADNVAKTYKAETPRKGTILTFVDAGTPKNPTPLEFLSGVKVVDETEGATDGPIEDAGGSDLEIDPPADFNLYDAMKAELVKRGIPSREIAYIHQARNGAERLALFKAMNEGKVRVMLASTDKGGVGMNVQERLASLEHYDAPRYARPGDITQREGRIIRQGNEYAKWGGVTGRRYVTKGTTDEWLYGLIGDKDNFIQQFVRGGGGNNYVERDANDIQEAKIAATGDPRGVELTQLRGSLMRLEAQAQASAQAVGKAKADKVGLTKRIETLTEEHESAKDWVKDNFVSMRGAKFSMRIGKETFADRGKANQALIARLDPKRWVWSDRNLRETIGEIGGLPVIAYAQQSHSMAREGIKGGLMRVEIDAKALEAGELKAADIPTHDEVVTRNEHGVITSTLYTPKEFGKGYDIVASIVNRYEGVPKIVDQIAEELQTAKDGLARAEHVIANPPESLQKLTEARTRVSQLESELRLEGQAVTKGPAEGEEGTKAIIIRRPVGQGKQGGRATTGEAPMVWRHSANGWERVPGGPVQVVGAPAGITFSAYKQRGLWYVVEDSSGLAPDNRGFGSRKEAVKAAESKVASMGPQGFSDAVARGAERNGPKLNLQAQGEPSGVVEEARTEEANAPKAPDQMRPLEEQARTIVDEARTVETIRRAVSEAARVPKPTPQDKAKIVEAFTPAQRGRAKELAAMQFRAELARRAHAIEHAIASLKAYRQSFVTLSRDPEAVLQLADAVELGGREHPIPAGFEEPIRSIRDLYEQAKAQIEAAGLSPEWRENYLARGNEWAGKGESREMEWIKRIVFRRRPLQGSKAFLKQRTFPTWRDRVEATGQEPPTWNMLDLQILKIREMYQFILGKRMADWMKGRGLTSGGTLFVPISQRAPKGLDEIKDPAFTVYKAPTVTVREAYDKVLMEGLEGWVNDLGVEHERKASSAKTWGQTTAAGPIKVTTKFGAPETVLIHEIGHALDRLGFGETLRQADPEIVDELLKLAALRYEGETPTDKFREYVERPQEQIANAVHAYIYAPHRMMEVAPKAYEAISNLADSDARLTPLKTLQGTRSLVLGEREAELPLGGPVLMGRYYALPEVARIINNHLAPGLHGRSALVDAWLWLNNAMVRSVLSFPGFHALAITKETGSMALASAMQHGAQGKGGKAAGRVAMAAAFPGEAYRLYMKGLRAQREYLTTDPGSAMINELTRQIILGGQRIHMERDYSNQSLLKLRDAITMHRWGGTLYHLVPGVLEAMSVPVMEWLVPRVKLGAYLDRIERRLAALPGDPDFETFQRIATEESDQVDNAFGEMVKDNLAWPRALHHALQGAMVSPMWNLGSLRGAGGGVKDLQRLIPGRRRKESYTGPDGKPGSQDEAIISARTAWMLGILVMAAYTAELYQRTHGAGNLRETKDVFAPRNGQTNPDGTPQRVTTPGYEKDLFAALHRLPGSLVTWALSKVGPLPSLAWSIWNNQDYTGTQVRNPDDPLWKQGMELLQQGGKQSTPMPVESLQRGKDQTAEQVGEHVMGVRPASREISRTDAELKLREYLGPTFRTQEQAAADRLKADVREALRHPTAANKARAGAALATGALSKAQLESLANRARFTALQAGFQRLTLDQALKVYQVATPAERQQLKGLLERKTMNAMRTVPPREWAQMRQNVRQALALPIGQ